MASKTKYKYMEAHPMTDISLNKGAVFLVAPRFYSCLWAQGLCRPLFLSQLFPYMEEKDSATIVRGSGVSPGSAICHLCELQEESSVLP